MMKHVIVDSDDEMESNHIPVWYPQGPVSQLPVMVHDILDDVLFIMCYEKWLVINESSILEPLTVKFSWSDGLFKILQGQNPLYFHIHTGLYCNSCFESMKVNKLVSMIWCQHNKSNKQSLLYTGQFQFFQMFLK